MKRSRKFTPCRFIPFRLSTSTRPADEIWLDVSSSAEPPLDQLSPFYPHGGIPIPGQEKMMSDSVEGIWQGLKVIRGKTAPRFFQGVGRKRGGGKPSGHQYGDEQQLLTLVQARQRIYLPAYRWMLENAVPPEVIQPLIDNCFRGIGQAFYDREDNGSIHKDEPLAHAKLLADYINERCETQLETG